MAPKYHFLSESNVLIVDNDSNNIALLEGFLKNHCKKIKIIKNAEDLFEVATSDMPPDIILLDINITKLSGYEICNKLKKHPISQNIPIILLVKAYDSMDMGYGFELGIADYITKPINPDILLARSNTHLEIKKIRAKIASPLIELNREERTIDIDRLIASQDAFIHAMSYLAETRDNVTGNHVRRIQLYVEILAEKLRLHPRFSHFLNNDERIELLAKTSPLHDIGNVEIPDRILLKPGRLTPQEFNIMKNHTRLGREIINRAEKDIAIQLPILQLIKDITYSHHERWDGCGYPEGLSENDIPIPARIICVADVYDALISRRVYKPALPHKEAVNIIVAGKGSQFDPDIVDAFQETQKEIEKITFTYADTDKDFLKRIEYLDQALSNDP